MIKIKILLVDNKSEYINKLYGELEKKRNVKVFCGSSFYEIKKICGMHLPDVALIDILSYHGDHNDLISHLRKELDSIKVVILIDDEESIISKIVNCSIDGCLYKAMSLDDLLLGIQASGKGMSVMPHGIYKEVVATLNASKNIKSSTDENISSKFLEISSRELEIITLIVNGKSNQEIADVLYLSEGRVRNILSELYKKLDVKNRVNLVTFAAEHNIF